MMQKLVACMLVGVVALVLADDDVSAAASPTHYTPQEKFLAQQTYGNFACRVNTLKVITENPGDAGNASLAVVTPQALRDAFAQVASLEWAHVLQASFASGDGRNDEKVLGTPGGDMGEFITALASYEKVTGKTLSEDDVLRLFEHYLKVMTREKFSYQTDEKAYMRLAVATGCRNLHVSDMGGMKRKKEAYLEKIAIPDHLGDPFIRFLAEQTTAAGVTLDLVHHALAAYHKVLWTSPSLLSSKLCYLEMKGSASREAALVHIRTPQYCVDQGLAPAVSPQMSCPAPVMINHVDAVRLFRRELVAVIADAEKVADQAKDILAATNQLAEENLNKYWSAVLPGMPVYTLEFGNSSPLLTTDVEFQE